jgi:DNA-binding SARP family transcriptional activator
MTTRERQANWHAALEFLKAGQYGQAAAILHEAQVSSEQMEDSVLSHLLAVARRVCLACSQCRAEREWHQQACEAADQREDELRQELQTILDLISEHQALNADEMLEMPPSNPLIEIPPPERISRESEERTSVWQRVQSLFARGDVSRFSEQEGVDGSAKVLASADYVAPRAGLTADERKTSPLSTAAHVKPGEQQAPSLTVYCLGPFRVLQDDQSVEEWPSSKGKAIFKYLITHRERPIAKEVLMELFWPSAQPDAARNNLNVAIYSLRQALRKARPSFPHVLFKDDCYLLNPELQIWVDCEIFTEHLINARSLERRDDQVAAIREYRMAEALYQGEFLEEERYEDWPIPERQRLQEDYLSMLDRLSQYHYDQGDDASCMAMCRKMLVVDPCREKAHRQLMRCYSRQGQPYLALRQFHLCVDRLKEELDVPPTPSTTVLYEKIRKAKR